ncbi:MAG: efflux RND transporter periplasmic adaptor subunit [Bacteroidota bacterium]
MKKKTKALLGLVAIIAVIIAILFYNKSKMAAQSDNQIINSCAVSIAEVKKDLVSNVNSLVGTVVANHDVAIAAEAAGKVVAVLAEVGDYKKKGDVLIQLDDELKQAALTIAEVTYNKAKKDLDRFESLATEHSVTDQQLETARWTFKSAEAQYITAKRQFEDTRIKTPISGVVTARNVDLGANVQTNNIIANVVDLATLKVKVNVSETDAFNLRTGDAVDVTTDVYPGVVYPGKIQSISAKADEVHTYPAEIVLQNSSGRPLKAGMFARVNFRGAGRDSVLIVPRMALVGSAKNPQVYVVQNNIANLRSITIGSEIGTNLQVLSGVNPGEKIVVNGQVNLKDNTAVTIVQ